MPVSQAPESHEVVCGMTEQFLSWSNPTTVGMLAMISVSTQAYLVRYTSLVFLHSPVNWYNLPCSFVCFCLLLSQDCLEPLQACNWQKVFLRYRKKLATWWCHRNSRPFIDFCSILRLCPHANIRGKSTSQSHPEGYHMTYSWSV